MIYQSAPGTRLACIFCDGFESGNTSLVDFTGNGKPDLVLTSEDDDGNLKDILVVNAASLDTLLEVWNVQQTLGYIDPGLIIYGFANVVGGDEPEAIFTSEHDVRLYDPSDNTLVWSVTADDDWEFPDPSIKVRLLAAIDFTGDDKKELLIFLPDTKELQVWHEKLP